MFARIGLGIASFATVSNGYVCLWPWGPPPAGEVGCVCILAHCDGINESVNTATCACEEDEQYGSIANVALDLDVHDGPTRAYCPPPKIIDNFGRCVCGNNDGSCDGPGQVWDEVGCECLGGITPGIGLDQVLQPYKP